jgi:hypothetical protein
MGQRIVKDGLILEVQPDGSGVVVGYADAPAQGRIFTLPPNPKDVRQEQRAEEDQQLQREAADRAERAAIRADKTAQRQAAAAERAAAAQTKPSEFQSKSAGFLGRMMQAEHDFALVPETDKGGRSIGRKALHDILPGVENTFVNSPNRQKADQAIENFIAASLRQESGAAISPMEFERQYKIFFPAAGDSPEVIAQKAAARRQAIEDFKLAAGPLADDAAGSIQKADNEVPDPTTGADTKPPSPTPDNLTAEQQTKFFQILRREGADKADEYLRQFGLAMKDKTAADQPYSERLEKAEGDYANSYLGQGLSGANEGLADVLGAPADVARAAINLVPKGLNAIAGTNIPMLPEAIGGSDWIKRRLSDIGSIQGVTEDPSKQFVRRVGESVGSAAVPLSGATTPLRYGGQVLAGLTGGIGAATAQQVAPGNPLAEMLGEIVGGGAGAGAVLRASKGRAARQIAEAVPTAPQLKEQAGDLYRAAESRGVVASPEQTQQLAENFRGALTDEGRISPTGRISDVYPKAKEAAQLIGDYAGHEMNPTQIQTVRGVVSDALASPEKTERRLGSILTDVLDQWADPLAPELRQARGVASRYLTAEQLQQARRLAGARASQFTGSGFENALRTEYRGLDRSAIKGNARFTDDVNDAIEKVARGTPTSNFFRGLGRFAPTGPVSGGGSLLTALATGAATTPGTGATVGGLLAGSGILGRTVATRMGIKAADDAELIARNGGLLPLPKPSPELLEIMRRYGLAETAKYLPQ